MEPLRRYDGAQLEFLPIGAYDGLEHGVARQWSVDGQRLIGSYRMRNGTGVDLW